MGVSLFTERGGGGGREINPNTEDIKRGEEVESSLARRFGENHQKPHIQQPENDPTAPLKSEQSSLTTKNKTQTGSTVDVGGLWLPKERRAARRK